MQKRKAVKHFFTLRLGAFARYFKSSVIGGEVETPKKSTIFDEEF
jgi:hypothetical protein